MKFDHFREDFFGVFALFAEVLAFEGFAMLPRAASVDFFTTLPMPRPMREWCVARSSMRFFSVAASEASLEALGIEAGFAGEFAGAFAAVVSA